MIKLVETQLLSSDLSTSTLSSPALVPSPIPLTTNTLFKLPTQSVLVQIISITEIGQSALGLMEVLKEKKELERLRLKNEEMGEQKSVVVADDGEEPVVEGQFGRGMLKFRLSDGFNEVDAIEWARIDGLRLGETQLGCKVSHHSSPLKSRLTSFLRTAFAQERSHFKGDFAARPRFSDHQRTCGRGIRGSCSCSPRS